MKTVSLSGSPRENVGKKDAKKNRKAGMIPCVMYGTGKQFHFIVEDKAFRKLIFTPEVYIVKILFEGQEFSTIIQDIQYHPVTDNILHVDFLEIAPGKPVTIGVPVKLEGTAPGVLKGGKLDKKMRKVTVKAQLEDLPDFIMVSIDPLDIGQSIKVKDLQRDKITFLDSPNNVVVAVRTARTVVEEVPGAPGAAAPAAGAAAEAKPEEKK